MKTQLPLLATGVATLLNLSPLRAQTQLTATIGGGGGDDTAAVPVSTWFWSDDAGATGESAAVGGIADIADFIGVLSFDLSELDGATSVTSVTIRLPQEGEIFDNRSGSLTGMATTLTELEVAPTNSATWHAYDGVNPWTVPGGRGDITGPAFLSNTFDLDQLVEDDARNAEIVIPTSPALEALILSKAGGRVDFLWRVPVAEGGAAGDGRNFVVFDGAGGGVNGDLDSSPQMEVSFELPPVDPDLIITVPPGNIRTDSTAGPATTSVSIQNTGATQNLIGSASVSGDGFSIVPPTAIDLAPGATQVFTLRFDPSAAPPATVVGATLTLSTNDPREPSVEVSFTAAPTDGIDIGSGGVDFATRGVNLGGSGITAYGWVRDDDPGRLAGGETSFMGTSNGTTMLRGYVGFDLSGFSPGDAVAGATVSLWSQGAPIFNANGGVVDIGETTIELRSLPEVTGFGDGFGNNAAVGGLPANWTNLSPHYGEDALATATANLDTIAFNHEVRFDVTEILQAAIANGDHQITFGLVAPGAEEFGTRNFFAMGGMVEHGASQGSETGPSLNIVLGSPDPIGITSVQRIEAGDEVDIVIAWNSRAGLGYAVEESTELRLGWTPAVDRIESEGSETTYLHTIPAPVPESFFLRVRQLTD